VASENVKEIIGTGLIDALKGLGDDTTVADLATNMENLATYTADVIRGFGLMAAALKKIPGLSGLTGASIVQAIPILGSYITLLNQAGAQARRSAEVNAQKNPIQSGSYLTTQKKITALTKEQQKAQAKILADKKSQAILDKANLALAKGNDVFNMDAIQLNAALIGQAEALGKATTGSQILAIANDVQRLKVKQDIAALEDAIASKDDAAIAKATAKLNEDLKILGALQRQDAKLLDINRVLAGMKSTDLINLANLQAALDLLAKFKFPTLTIPGVVIPTPVAPGLPGPGVGGRGGDAGRGSTFGANPLDDFLTILEAETERGGRRAGGIGDTNYVALPPGFSSVDEYLKESRGNRGASDAGTVIVNVNAGAVGDENIIIDAVQNALNEIARRGYTTTYAGAIAV
jgi:hypothetical protein